MRVTGPPFVVTIEFVKLIALVPILIPPEAFVVKPPANVVVPVPPVCVNAPKLASLLKVTFNAVPIVREVSGAEFPTNPTKLTELPAPGLIVNLRLLIAASAFKVLLNVKTPEKTRLSAAMITGDP